MSKKIDEYEFGTKFKYDEHVLQLKYKGLVYINFNNRTTGEPFDRLKYIVNQWLQNGILQPIKEPKNNT